MLHIIILAKNYFPAKLNTFKPNDKVIILASPDGSIPVSAYRDELLKNLEIRLLPDINETASAEGKNDLRIAQAMVIGQITAQVKDFEIYTDDSVLLRAIAPFTGNRQTAKKKASSKPSELKAESANEAVATKMSHKESSENGKKKSQKKTAIKEAEIEEPEVSTESREVKKKSPSEDKPEKKVSKAGSADKKMKQVKLPTQAEVKRILGAANSGYAKPIMDVIKKSNQITFEMDLRMKLAEAGMDQTQCQELARTINEEFGKALPVSI